MQLYELHLGSVILFTGSEKRFGFYGHAHRGRVLELKELSKTRMRVKVRRNEYGHVVNRVFEESKSLEVTLVPPRKIGR